MQEKRDAVSQRIDYVRRRIDVETDKVHDDVRLERCNSFPERSVTLGLCTVDHDFPYGFPGG